MVQAQVRLDGYYRTFDTFMSVQSLMTQTAVLQKKKSSEMDVRRQRRPGAAASLTLPPPGRDAALHQGDS
jgi:hypothetical protein